MVVMLSNGQRIPHFCIPRPSKIYPNLDLGFENKPSGNLSTLI
jgi:hypothetical protein